MVRKVAFLALCVCFAGISLLTMGAIVGFGWPLWFKIAYYSPLLDKNGGMDYIDFCIRHFQLHDKVLAGQSDNNIFIEHVPQGWLDVPLELSPKQNTIWTAWIYEPAFNISSTDAYSVSVLTSPGAFPDRALFQGQPAIGLIPVDDNTVAQVLPYQNPSLLKKHDRKQWKLVEYKTADGYHGSGKIMFRLSIYQGKFQGDSFAAIQGAGVMADPGKLALVQESKLLKDLRPAGSKGVTL